VCLCLHEQNDGDKEFASRKLGRPHTMLLAMDVYLRAQSTRTLIHLHKRTYTYIRKLAYMLHIYMYIQLYITNAYIRLHAIYAYILHMPT